VKDEVKVSSFDVLKRMSEENLDIRLATSENLTHMKAAHKGLDTDITIGVAGNIISQVLNNDLNLCLFVWNRQQYRDTTEKLKKEKRKNNEDQATKHTEQTIPRSL
jgi:hypothetical protein